jgi:hypothetical protein
MVVADPDEALIEAIAEAIRSHRVEVWMAPNAHFGWHCLTCQQERDPFTRSVEVAEQDAISHSARAAFAAMVEHLGLVEEWSVRHAQGIHPGPFTEEGARHWIAQDIKNDERRRWEARGKQRLLRRLVQSRWVEVDHGSE